MPTLVEFLKLDNKNNWRFRQELADQLLLSIPLFTPIETAKHIGKIAQCLLADQVAAVRESSILLSTELIKYISNEKMLTQNGLVRLAERFAHSKKWKLRQTFALLSAEILRTNALPYEIFVSEIMPHLLDLSWDPVPNVRLVVARTISTYLMTNGNFYYTIILNYSNLFIEYVNGLLSSILNRDSTSFRAD